MTGDCEIFIRDTYFRTYDPDLQTCKIISKTYVANTYGTTSTYPMRKRPSAALGPRTSVRKPTSAEVGLIAFVHWVSIQNTQNIHLSAFPCVMQFFRNQRQRTIRRVQSVMIWQVTHCDEKRTYVCRSVILELRASSSKVQHHRPADT